MSHYDQLLKKADAFFELAREHGADLQCAEGCTACCRVELTVSRVEADSIRQHVRASSRREVLQRRAEQGPDGHCVMLVEGRCAIYESRPLVCRTQGLALAYPPGVIPEDAVRGRGEGVEVTWCPLNFTSRPVDGADVLAAGTLDEALALVNRAHCDALDVDPLERLSLREIAADP